jgi:hypothetical protein
MVKRLHSDVYSLLPMRGFGFFSVALDFTLHGEEILSAIAPLVTRGAI